jgi:hypothetical protein
MILTIDIHRIELFAIYDVEMAEFEQLMLMNLMKCNKLMQSNSRRMLM